MKRKLFAAVAASSLAAACGGSGGGAGGSIQPPAALMNIDGSNAASASAVAYIAARDSAALGELSGEAGFIAGDAGGTAASGVGVSKPGNGGIAQIPLPEQVVPCDISGEVIFNIDLADPITPTLTAGDSFDIEFDMCVDTIGESTDGLLAFEVDAFAGEFLSGLYDLTMTMSLTNFNVVTPEDNILSSGAATVRLDTEQAPYIESSISGERFTVDSNAASQSLLDFSSTQTFDGTLSPAPWTLTASGTVDSSELSGSVSYSTPVTFQGFDADYPGSGELLVEGENSAARLIALSNVDVQVLVDADGNGDFETEILTTWAELLNQ